MVQSVGFGFRYRSPIGPIGLDFSFSPDAPRFYGFKGNEQQVLDHVPVINNNCRAWQSAESQRFPISFHAGAGFLMRLAWLLACVLLPVHGEIIDRLAITVGSQVITELQIDEELRVTALLNHEPGVVRTLDTRREAADRLVEQLIIRIEMQLSRYDLPEAGDVDKYYQQIEEANGRRRRIFDRTLKQVYARQRKFCAAILPCSSPN